MNKTYNDNERVWAVERALISVEKEEVEKNLIQSKYSNNDNFEVYPVVYLKANLVLKVMVQPQNHILLPNNEK